MGKEGLFICFLIFFVGHIEGHSNSSSHHEEHVLSRWGAWQGLSFIGCVGIFSNTVLLHTMYVEPNMATPVNAMILMETIYRTGYNVFILWRTFNLASGSTLFGKWLNREQVKKQQFA